MTESKKKPAAPGSQDGSLKYLAEKYRKGSPRVIQEPPPNPAHTFGAEKKPQKLFLPNQRASVASAFNKSQKAKPPLSQFSAAEVREQTKLDNQEQVLMVQLEKLEGKLEAKLKEV